MIQLGGVRNSADFVKVIGPVCVLTELRIWAAIE